jgi:forkhead box protein K
MGRWRMVRQWQKGPSRCTVSQLDFSQFVTDEMSNYDAYRTQITIANQTFHFLLPSAPDSDDSQSITSHPSSREHSVSVDIMSMSAGSAPASESDGPTDDDREDVGSKPRVGKKRKKMSASPPKRPKGKLQSKKIPPEEMPPKPAITYANLSYRAIKSQHGRAALQDICRWIAANFEWYRLNEGSGWEVGLCFSPSHLLLT